MTPPGPDLVVRHRQGELGMIDMFSSGRLDRLVEARRRAAVTGAARTLAALDLQLVAAHYMVGNAEEARAAACRAIEGATASGLGAVRARATMSLPHAAALRGDRVAVERDVAAIPTADLALDPDAHAGVWGTARGMCSLLMDDHVGAAVEFETAARIASRASEVTPHSWWGFWALLRAIDGGDAGAAVARLRSGPAVVNRQNAAIADLVEAVLAGRRRDAVRATAIVDEFGAGESPWIWQRQLGRRLVAGAALRDGWGRPTEWLTEAAHFFDGFGTPAVAAGARALVATASPPPVPGVAGVSPREGEVLDLISGGLTNRELARRLAISPRTVEKHVASLCRKLGTSGRGPLIALAASRRTARS